MGKVSELSMLVDELKKCGETLISISEELIELFSSAEPEKQPAKKNAAKKKEPEPPAEKELTLEEVRAVLADKSRAGFTEQVKVLLKKHGADKLSAVDPAEYKALLADAGGAGKCRISTQSCQHHPVTGGLPARRQHSFVPRKRMYPVNLPCRERTHTVCASSR